MYSIHKQATLIAKGQVTLPKAIREAVGVSAGAKVNFEIREGQVIVSRADVVHEAPPLVLYLTCSRKISDKESMWILCDMTLLWPCWLTATGQLILKRISMVK